MPGVADLDPPNARLPAPLGEGQEKSRWIVRTSHGSALNHPADDSARPCAPAVPSAPSTTSTLNTALIVSPPWLITGSSWFR